MMLRRILPTSFLYLLPTNVLVAQGEIVDYSFEARDADQVVNYARGSAAAPALGELSWPAFYSYTDGRFGSALKHSSFGGLAGRYVRTGWTAGHTGALTIAFFLRNGIANSPDLYSPIAGQPSWSLASGGSAGPGLQLRGWGGPALNGDFGTALWNLTGWNHFAIVIDPAAGTGTWYRNGAVASVTKVSGGASIAAQGQLYVGTDYVSWCGGLYDIDEFRFVGRAASSAEIMAWAGRATAGTAVFAHAGGKPVMDTVGAPVLGNVQFAAALNGQAHHAYVVLLGRSYARFGARELPFDLSAMLPIAPGQSLRVAPMVLHVGGLDGGGEARVPLPIPEDPALAGAALYGQALIVSATAQLTAGNAVAIRLGH